MEVTVGVTVEVTVGVTVECVPCTCRKQACPGAAVGLLGPVDRLPLARDHCQTGHAGRGVGVREGRGQSSREWESVAPADDEDDEDDEDDVDDEDDEYGSEVLDIAESSGSF